MPPASLKKLKSLCWRISPSSLHFFICTTGSGRFCLHSWQLRDWLPVCAQKKSNSSICPLKRSAALRFKDVCTQRHRCLFQKTRQLHRPSDRMTLDTGDGQTQKQKGTLSVPHQTPTPPRSVDLTTLTTARGLQKEKKKTSNSLENVFQLLRKSSASRCARSLQVTRATG